MANNKIVLAYSGGLDTSVILHWLRENTGSEVVAFAADLGQGGKDELDRAMANAATLKAQIVVEDLREEFISDFVFPMWRANALYEGVYLLGTSIARPLIAARQVALAQQINATGVAHGATGKGNDQVRFELAYAALAPHLKVYAPWRSWQFQSRSELLEYAKRHIAISGFSGDEPPYSTDANLLHISYEGKVLEDPWQSPPEDMFRLTVSPQQAPDKPQEVIVAFTDGDPVAVDGKTLSPAKLVAHLNKVAGANGIGRVDMVENRFIGIKSRGVYETPAGTVIAVARRALESITLAKHSAHLKDELMPRYAELVYNGFWFSEERQMLQAAIDTHRHQITGEVRLLLYKGNVVVKGRRSPHSLYDASLATFEAEDVFTPADAGGFIKLNALGLNALGANAPGLKGIATSQSKAPQSKATQNKPPKNKASR